MCDRWTRPETAATRLDAALAEANAALAAAGYPAPVAAPWRPGEVTFDRAADQLVDLLGRARRAALTADLMSEQTASA